MFIDDFTWSCLSILHKSEPLDCFEQYLYLVKNQLDRIIEVLRTDKGRGYLSDQFKALCQAKA